jgi:hypothetical protein
VRATCCAHLILLDLIVLITLGESTSYEAPPTSTLLSLHPSSVHISSSAPCSQTPSIYGLSPRANYTDRATAACRRSDCQLVRIEGATWSA